MAGLWEAATEEKRREAHRRCVVLLEIWLGRKRREQAAKELELTPVRLWQLSQSAVSGMLAGLLKQPRRRGRAMMRQLLDGQPADDPVMLRKEIAELRSKLKISEDLIAILRDLPGHRDKPASSPGDTARVPMPPRAAGTGKKRKRAARPPRAAVIRDVSDAGPAPG